MCLRDQIFRVLLEHFISAVVRKWQWDQLFYVLVHFVINFVSKWLREQLFEDFCCKSKCYISYSPFTAKGFPIDEWNRLALDSVKSISDLRIWNPT